MHLLRGREWTPKNIVKWLAIGLVALVFASFVFSFVRSSFESARFGMPSPSPGRAGQGRIGMGLPGQGGGESNIAFSPGMAGGMMQKAYDYDEAAYDYGYGSDAVGLSARNVAMMEPSIAPIPPIGGYSTGNTAEEYEVTEYSASIETQDKTATCGKIASLKSYSYVIFESANEYDRGCDYRFKVEHARVAEILSFVKDLDPKDLNENTYTIKNLIDDYTSETEVLEKKRRAIDDTLEEALAAYDEITELATQSGDASSLAKIIDSKVQLIERLTQERININTQLDRLARAKAEQLDRLAYTYFNVSVHEQHYFDGDDLKDSWKASIQATIYEVNIIFQELTFGLIYVIFFAVQWIIYILLAVFVARHVWKWVKRIWKGEMPAKRAPKNGLKTRSVKRESTIEVDNG